MSDKRTMPKRIVELDLPEPYDLFTVEVWVNYGPDVDADLRSGDLERLNSAVGKIVVAHDLVDFDGNPYPPATDPAFWSMLPNEVAILLIRETRGQVGRLDPQRRGR